MPKYVVSFDPGLSTFGLSVICLNRDPDKDVVETLAVYRTQKSDKKRKVLAADDNVRRNRELIRAVRPPVISRIGNVIAFCAEAMSFPRNSSAAAKIALSWGMIVTLSEIHSIPIIQASPKEIKKATTGRASASKEDVEDALKDKYLIDGALLTEFYAAIPKTAREHAWDALGAFVACQESEAIRLARKML